MFFKGLSLFGKKQQQDKDEASSETAVNEQVSASVADTSAEVLGLNTAYSLDQSLMAQSQAHGVLFANMVSEQQRQITAGQAAAIKSAADLIGVDPEKLMPSIKSQD